MELEWLEDFLALAEHRNFSRAAEARHITQPAFSRRIRALETWIGTPLASRSPQAVVLNPAGEYLRDHATPFLHDLHEMRRAVLRMAGQESAALAIAATNALSFSFFPAWIRSCAPMESLGPVNLISDNMADCENAVAAGKADFLLCHHHPAIEHSAPLDNFASLQVGQDRLEPLSMPDSRGAPRWPLNPPDHKAVRLLTYSAASGLGRVLDAVGYANTAQPSANAVFTSSSATALLSMAMQGQGLAWLPRSLARDALQAGRLVHAAEDSISVSIEIRLFRPKRRLSAVAERFWATIASPPLQGETGPCAGKTG